MLGVGSYFDIGLIEPAGNWFVGKNAICATTVDDRVPNDLGFQVREWCPGIFPFLRRTSKSRLRSDQKH